MLQAIKSMKLSSLNQVMPKLSKCVRHILASPPFTKYLLTTNLLFGGAIDFLGDLVAQRKIEKAKSTNWERSGRMVTVSLALGLPSHYWYLALDRWLPLHNRQHVMKKVLVDTLGAGPFLIAGFFVGMSQLEGKTWQESKAELREKFLPTFMVDLIYWPLMQGINFYFLPTSLRLVFANSAYLGWSMLLSTLKHNDIEYLKGKATDL